MTQISIVVPVFNSEDSLERLCSRLTAVLAAECSAFEIILIEDCGTDNSWKLIEKLARENNRIRGFQLSRNFGQHNALLCGIQKARYGITVTIDDDLQNPPEEIPNLVAKLDQGYDVVYGKPRTQRHGLWRNLASQITKFMLQKSMGAQTARKISSFRAFRTDLRNAFLGYNGVFVCIDVLLSWGTTNFSAVPVEHNKRATGSSNYSTRKLIHHTLAMVTGFSTLPLKLASLIGFFFTLFGIVVLGYVLLRWFQSGSVVPGFAFLASIIAIFSGAQLFSLGILGEYLSGMHFRSMGKPPYIVRNSLENDK